MARVCTILTPTWNSEALKNRQIISRIDTKMPPSTKGVNPPLVNHKLLRSVVVLCYIVISKHCLQKKKEKSVLFLLHCNSYKAFLFCIFNVICCTSHWKCWGLCEIRCPYGRYNTLKGDTILLREIRFSYGRYDAVMGNTILLWDIWCCYGKSDVLTEDTILLWGDTTLLVSCCSILLAWCHGMWCVVVLCAVVLCCVLC